MIEEKHRKVELSGNIRIVTVHIEESWWRYVIAPAGTDVSDWLEEPYYGGPGAPFVHRPSRITSSPRYVVFFQTGGLDV